MNVFENQCDSDESNVKPFSPGHFYDQVAAGMATWLVRVSIMASRSLTCES